MSLPFSQLSKIPTDRLVDATPELWNRTYRELDSNLASLDGRVSDLEAISKKTFNGASLAAQADYAAQVTARVLPMAERGIVSSINGRSAGSGGVVLSAADIPGAVDRATPVFTGHPTVVDDMTDAADQKIATRGFVSRMLGKLFGFGLYTVASGSGHTGGVCFIPNELAGNIGIACINVTEGSAWPVTVAIPQIASKFNKCIGVTGRNLNVANSQINGSSVLLWCNNPTPGSGTNAVLIVFWKE